MQGLQNQDLGRSSNYIIYLVGVTLEISHFLFKSFSVIAADKREERVDDNSVLQVGWIRESGRP
jgi:hypothetical protein